MFAAAAVTDCADARNFIGHGRPRARLFPRFPRVSRELSAPSFHASNHSPLRPGRARSRKEKGAAKRPVSTYMHRLM
ncbi:hypothetical protein PERCYII29_2536 [Pseudomonas aeruginosa]|nr:hypothetical protein PERCYII29_2536 [Pseudomonas aeruginosa]